MNLDIFIFCIIVLYCLRFNFLRLFICVCKEFLQQAKEAFRWGINAHETSLKIALYGYGPLTKKERQNGLIALSVASWLRYLVSMFYEIQWVFFEFVVRFYIPYTTWQYCVDYFHSFLFPPTLGDVIYKFTLCLRSSSLPIDFISPINSFVQYQYGDGYWYRSFPNVMDQFGSGELRVCPYAPVGISRWVIGLCIFFYVLGIILVIFFRNVNFLIDGEWQLSIKNFAQFFLNLVKGNIELYYYFINVVGLLFSIFILIILLNLLSLIPYTFAYTSHIIFTFTLSSYLISLSNFWGLERHGFEFIKIFLPGGAPLFLAPFLIFIELVSYNTRVLSLAIRLFANIMSGHILLTIFAGFSVSLGILKSFVLNLLMLAIYGLEQVIGFLQGYVFLTLSTIYFHENIYLH